MRVVLASCKAEQFATERPLRVQQDFAACTAALHDLHLHGTIYADPQVRAMPFPQVILLHPACRDM